MDINEYIKSGILESYLMGELLEQQMIEVDKMAEQYPEVKKEIEELRVSILTYAKANDQHPKKAILEKVFDEPETADAPISQLQVTKPIKRLWLIAASVALLISIGFNVYYSSELRKTKREAEKLVAERDLMSAQVETVQQELDYASLRIAHFLSDDNIHVRMDGSQLSPRSFANVFWNKNSNAVFISVDNLPEPPHGHQYQLWAIKENQAPIDAGIFDHNNLVQELKVIKGEVIAFAVTLEVEGGTPNATVEKTFVKGFLKKS